jgi:polyhydroxyalkanoate synthesis regulator phasin
VATNTEKIDELFKIAHTLTERVDALREEVKGVWPDVSKVTDAVAGLTTQAALLEQRVVELKAWKDQLGVPEVKAEVTVLKEKVKKIEDEAEKRGNRAWSIVPNIIGAIVNGLLAAAVAYFVARRGGP